MYQYLIKSYRGGVSDENNKGIEGSFKFGYGLDIHDKDDVLKCKQTLATLEESIIDGLILFFVGGSDGSTYMFADNGDIYARSGDGAVNLAYTDTNGKIRGAAEWKLSDGNTYLFWATATSLARKLINGSPDLTWAGVEENYKTTLESVDWHTMVIASGQLNIANGNYLASITYAESFNAQQLNIVPGNIIKTLEERDDYTILGSIRKNESEEGHIWSWITTATNWVQKKKIPIKGVNALINTELMLLQGGDDGEIFFSDFINAIPLHGIPGGGQVNPGGVSIEDDRAIFGFYGGSYPGLWSYGRKRKNRPFTLNFDYRLAKTILGSTVSSIGAVAVINNELLVSWGTTDGSISDYGLDGVSSTTKTAAIYEGLEFNSGTAEKKTFQKVKIIMDSLPSGTSFAVKYKADRTTTGGDSSAGAGFKYALVANSTATTFSLAGETEAEFIINNNMKIIEIGAELFPFVNDTPNIILISVDFE
ncbi:MAG: hypothetical protein AAB706_02125 [Patescibacteria group bacterium]